MCNDRFKKYKKKTNESSMCVRRWRRGECRHRKLRVSYNIAYPTKVTARKKKWKSKKEKKKPETTRRPDFPPYKSCAVSVLLFFFFHFRNRNITRLVVATRETPFCDRKRLQTRNNSIRLTIIFFFFLFINNFIVHYISTF